MNAKKRNRFWALHSILGISLGLPLFVIFVAGTLALFAPESVNWTHPQFGDLEAQPSSLDGEVQELLGKHPNTDELSVVLATPHRPVVDLYLESNHERTHYWLHPQSGEVTPAVAHDADLFHFFVDLHYFEFVPFGTEISGIIAALFFAIILTGFVFQWRSLKQDSRPSNLKLSGRGRWKKVHRLTSLLTLPFQVIYSVTGASLAVGLFLAAPAVWVFFDGDQSKLNETLFPEHMAVAAPIHENPTFPVDAAFQKAGELWGESVEPLIVHVERAEEDQERPARHTVMVQGKPRGLYFVGNSVVTFDEELNVLHSQSPTSHLGPMMIEALVNLHFATFNGFVFKVIFALFGLVVALSIGAGVYILLQRRLEGASATTRKTRALETVVNWILGGLPLAVAVALQVSQLAPDWPVKAFWVVMVLAFCLMVFFPKSLPRLTLASAVIFVLSPLSFWLAHGQSPLKFGGAHSLLVTFLNLFFVLVGAALALLVWRIGQGGAGANLSRSAQD